MKQLVILSGKGGTGKTSLSAAFAHLAGESIRAPGAVLVDADVDAANLGLVLRPDHAEAHDFWGGSLAEIDPLLCETCGACFPVCRYDAVLPGEAAYQIDPLACDGCAACVYACPTGAIRMQQQQEGRWFQSNTPYGAFFHAELFPGKENSGKLVTLVKERARLFAEDTHAPLVIVDGPPGIGCPVISACAGADLGLVVTEPGQSGLHDLKRILGTLRHFRVPALICINKADLYPQGAREIQTYAAEQDIEVLGEIPFDEQIPQAMLRGAPVSELFPDSPAALAVKHIWKQAIARLFVEKVEER